MRRRSFILFMTLILGLPWMTMAQNRYSGNGTESDPYLIQSVSDWDSFADAVKNGTSYAGKYFKLMDDITVTKTVGGGDHSDQNDYYQGRIAFRGVFDGNNHTITMNNITVTKRWAGLFDIIYGSNVAIRNLKVTGSITSTVSSGNASNLGGIVGAANQGIIENCWCDATITAAGNCNSGIVADCNGS